MQATLSIGEYRRSLGLPSFGLGLDHSILSPNGRVSRRQREASERKLSETFRALDAADNEYVRKVRAGEIIDPTGKYSIEAMKRDEAEHTRQSIEALEREIRSWSLIGMGKRGIKLKYQRAIDRNRAKIAALSPVAE